MDDKKWCYSINGENFTGDCNSREEAIAEAECEYGEYCGTIYVGVIQEVGISFNIDIIIEAIQENAYDECGEYAEEYLNDVTKEHRQILEDRVQDIVLKWMEEFEYEPNFWTVGEVEQIELNDI